jgi:hypothetical protein
VFICGVYIYIIIYIFIPFILNLIPVANIYVINKWHSYGFVDWEKHRETNEYFVNNWEVPRGWF